MVLTETKSVPQPPNYTMVYAAKRNLIWEPPHFIDGTSRRVVPSQRFPAQTPPDSQRQELLFEPFHSFPETLHLEARPPEVQPKDGKCEHGNDHRHQHLRGHPHVAPPDHVGVDAPPQDGRVVHQRDVQKADDPKDGSKALLPLAVARRRLDQKDKPRR